MADRVLTTMYKPAGVPVLPPHDHPQGPCVLAALLERDPWRRQVPWPQGFAGGLAHRLDRSTSGAVAVADDLADLAWLRQRFASKDLLKTYQFWSARQVSWDAHACDAPLAHDRRHKSRMVVRRSANTPHRGRWFEAHTAFERVEGQLWQAQMRTGVTHQIRLHAAFLGIPILGDRRYGGGPTPPDADPGVDFFLHHRGFEGPGIVTQPVVAPAWIERARRVMGD